MITLRGLHGKTLIADEAVVKIVKKGGLFSSEKEKVFPIGNIGSIEVRKPGFVSPGLIRISVIGDAPDERAISTTSDDENAVEFRGTVTYRLAQQIKEQATQERVQPQRSGSNPLWGCVSVILVLLFLPMLGTIVSQIDSSHSGGDRSTQKRDSNSTSSGNRSDLNTKEKWIGREDAGDVQRVVAAEEPRKSAGQKRSDPEAETELGQESRPDVVVYALRVDNIRSGPGTQYKILRKTYKYEKLICEEKEGGWYPLAVDVGEPEVWVHESVVRTVIPESRGQVLGQTIRVDPDYPSSPLYNRPVGTDGDTAGRYDLTRIPGGTRLKIIEWVDKEVGAQIIRYFKVAYNGHTGWLGQRFTDRLVYSVQNGKEVSELMPGFDSIRWVDGRVPDGLGDDWNLSFTEIERRDKTKKNGENN